MMDVRGGDRCVGRVSRQVPERNSVMRENVPPDLGVLFFKRRRNMITDKNHFN